jgi:hypothetical protein
MIDIGIQRGDPLKFALPEGYFRGFGCNIRLPHRNTVLHGMVDASAEVPDIPGLSLQTIR